MGGSSKVQIRVTQVSMNNYTPHPDYDELPDCIKYLYTEKEFAWLGDFDRNRLLETECCPDAEGDD